jgi:biotin carboxyl carrier protein
LKKFKLTIGEKTYEVAAERDAADPARLNLTVDGEAHSIQIEEEQAPRQAAPRARPAAAPIAAGAGGGGKILAPIPGTVFTLDVSEGDSVSAGDKLLILEAMKMENVISADTDGRVNAIHVKKGDKVDAGQLLMEIG